MASFFAIFSVNFHFSLIRHNFSYLFGGRIGRAGRKVSPHGGFYAAPSCGTPFAAASIFSIKIP